MVTFDPSLATRQAIAALTPSSFEQLAFDVVRVSHPGVERLRAPDGGADLKVEGPPVHVWQAKHNMARIDWASCRESLERAVREHQPQFVTFIFPKDLTALESKKFSALKEIVPAFVAIDYHGFSWFNAELDHPQLVGARQHLLTAQPLSLLRSNVEIAHPPVVPSYWTARSSVNKSLEAWWLSGLHNIIALVGIGGTGKSTVTQRWLDGLASGSRDREFEAIVQFSLYEHGDRPFRQFLELTIRTLGIVNDGADMVDSIVNHLAHHKVLLVLDGAERLLREYATAAPDLVEEKDEDEIPFSSREVVDESAWRFLTSFASRRLDGRLVLTTRLMPVDLDLSSRCLRLDVGGLNESEAIALLRKLGVEGLDQELSDAVVALDGHPLSLARLANVLRSDLLAPYDVRNAILYNPALDLRRRRHDIFGRAFDLLCASHRDALFLLACGRGTITATDFATLASMAGLTSITLTIKALLDELWIQRTENGNIRLHSVARRFLVAHDSSAALRHSYYVRLWAPRANDLNFGAIEKDPSAGLMDLRAATELVFHMARSGSRDEAYKRFDGELAAILGDRYSAHSARLELLLEFFERNDLAGEVLLSDQSARGSLLNTAANSLAFLGQPMRAIPLLERALRLAPQSSQSWAVRIGNLAVTRIRTGQLRQANHDLRQQEDIGSELHDLTNVLVARQERARLLTVCGQYLAAAQLLEDADDLLLQLANSPDKAMELWSPVGWPAARKRRLIVNTRALVGAIHRVENRVDMGENSVAAARQAVELAQPSEPRGLLRAEAAYGRALLGAGEHIAARELLNGLLDRAYGIGLADIEPLLLAQIAISWAPYQSATAFQFAHRAATLARRNGHRLYLAEALFVKAKVSRGRRRTALLEEAAVAARCDGHPYRFERVARSIDEISKTPAK